MDGFRKQAKVEALKEILTMLGDMENEPFMPKPEVKAVKVGVVAEKPYGMNHDMGEGMKHQMGQEMSEENDMENKKEEENGIELEAKGANLEELKRKLAELLK
jgi:hypothetical protein